MESTRLLRRAAVLKMILLNNRQFHDGMRAHVRLDDGECAGCILVKQRLHQGYVLPTLLFNSFAEVIHVASSGFELNMGVIDSVVGHREYTGASGVRKQWAENQP